jgi:UDP-2-acetamido-2-deoxy-ribo-hexuluronate aminotransferase
MEIKMVDLKSQYLQIKNYVDSGIQEVIDQTSFIKGPAVQLFQEELEKYLGAKHVIACANGTDALQIAMMALGLKPGDEVITASFTYVATAEVIALLGLKPVLVEVNPDTFLIDPTSVEAAITPQTKAIVPVHLFGQCADMEAILDMANKHKLYVIEDTAQAIGASFTFSDGTVKKAGCMGIIGCTSFFPSKNLGCFGDGGAMYTDDDVLAQKIRMIANHGQSIQYHHDIIGVNSRLDTLQAAILRAKLPHLDDYNTKRNEAAAYYDRVFEAVEGLKIPKRAAKTNHVFHQYTLQLSVSLDREELRKYLSEKGIPSMVYYPLPLHKQKAYIDDRYPQGHFRITEELCDRVLSLPMHTALTIRQLEYISNHVISFITKQKS